MGKKIQAVVRWSRIDISWGDVLHEIKLGDGKPLAREIAARRAFAARAKSDGLSVTADEVTESIGAFYADRDLLDAAAIAGWLEKNNLKEEELRRYMGEVCLADRWREHLASDETIQNYFAEHEADFARMAVEIAGCKTAGAAREVLLAAREGEAEWKFDEFRTLQRREAPEEIAAALFAANPGDWFGPVETDDGAWEVWRIRNKEKAVLDDALRDLIREELIAREIETLFPEDEIEFEGE